MKEISDLEQHPAVAGIRAHVPEAIAELKLFRGELTIVMRTEHLRPVAEVLAFHPELAFTFLSDITCVDRFPIDPRFELNYHLMSLHLHETVRLRVHLTEPLIDTVVPVWPTANWHERESFDLFGIRFEGHPDLRRLLLPDGWEGYPLRKDYPTEGPR